MSSIEEATEFERLQFRLYVDSSGKLTVFLVFLISKWQVVMGDADNAAARGSRDFPHGGGCGDSFWLSNSCGCREGERFDASKWVCIQHGGVTTREF